MDSCKQSGRHVRQQSLTPREEEIHAQQAHTEHRSEPEERGQSGEADFTLQSSSEWSCTGTSTAQEEDAGRAPVHRCSPELSLSSPHGADNSRRWGGGTMGLSPPLHSLPEASLPQTAMKNHMQKLQGMRGWEGK